MKNVKYSVMNYKRWLRRLKESWRSKRLVKSLDADWSDKVHCIVYNNCIDKEGAKNEMSVILDLKWEGV